MRKSSLIGMVLAAIGAVGAVFAQVPVISTQAKPQAVAIVTPSAAPRVPGAQGGRQPLVKADLDAWLDGFVPLALSNGDVAGAVVVVVRDGQIMTQRGYGYADVARRTRVDPAHTLFRPGSVSKLVTWTAVMQMVEAGRIDLDADVNRYLDFRIPARDGKPITMRMIMTHTPGFADVGKALMTTNPRHKMALGAYLKSWVPPRIFAAGTTPAYSNYATALAGYVVERVSGIPFDDYVEARVFAPLGMANSTFRQPLPPRFRPQMAQGYHLASSGEPHAFEIFQAPEGGMSSTGADMARFMIAHLNEGAGLMSPATARMMHDTPTTIVPPLNRMKLGFFETNVNGRKLIGHLGDTVAFHSALHLFMADKTGVYLSVNSAGREGAAQTIRTTLLQSFADRYFPSSVRDGRVDAKTAADHARMMTGMWGSSRAFASGLPKLTGLLGQTLVGLDGKGGLAIPSFKNAGGAIRQWDEIAPFVWRERGGQERLAAVVNDGHVVRWSVDRVSPVLVYDRVPFGLQSSWLLPLLYASLAILLVSFIHWPVAAVVRRKYAAPFTIEGSGRRAYRAVRLMCGLVLATLIAWGVGISTLIATPANFNTDYDPMLWVLQIVGAIVFVGAVFVAAWNDWFVFRTKRGWKAKLWAVLVLVATLTVLYVAARFGMLDMTVNY